MIQNEPYVAVDVKDHGSNDVENVLHDATKGRTWVKVGSPFGTLVKVNEIGWIEELFFEFGEPFVTFNQSGTKLNNGLPMFWLWITITRMFSTWSSKV